MTQYWCQLRACLHGGGGPQIGEVTCGGSPHLSCKRHEIKMRDSIERQVTPPKRVTSPSRGPPPPCKQALLQDISHVVQNLQAGMRETQLEQGKQRLHIT